MRLEILRAAVFCVAIGIAMPALRVFAHAFPSAEEPKVGSSVSTPPPQVVIHYDNRIEPVFAKLAVADSKGDSVTAGAPVVSTDRLSLSVKLGKLSSGAYTVSWAVTAEDGHRTQGSYQFTVTGASN